MKIQLVSNDRGVAPYGLRSEFFDSFEAVEEAGHKLMPPAAYESRLLREELRGQRQIDGFAGPMWGGHDDDGQPIIRFEDWAAYERLSR